VPTQSQSLLKQPQTIYLTTRGNVFGQQQGRVVIPKLNIKVEPGTAGEPHCRMHLFNLLFWFGISLNLSRYTHLWHTGWLTPQMNERVRILFQCELSFVAIFRVPRIACQPVCRMRCNSLEFYFIDKNIIC
jgi:hypothetical protein